MLVQKSPSEPLRTNVLGVGISAINLPVALEIIDDWIARRDNQYVCVSTVHSVMECQHDGRLRSVLNNSGLTTPDGMPLVWLNRLNGFRAAGRVYGPDLMLEVCQRSVARGYRHFLYGGNEGVAERLADRLRGRFPGLQVVGAYCPPFRPLSLEEDEHVTALINGTRPDVVWVGLSTPKQDHWMASHLGRVKAPVMLGVGAAFDFHAGVKRQAPRWMMRLGLEWLFRLSQEPGRLWHRYLVYNPSFVALVALQLAGLRRYVLPYDGTPFIQESS